jgi:hypothetical protein
MIKKIIIMHYVIKIKAYINLIHISNLKLLKNKIWSKLYL